MFVDGEFIIDHVIQFENFEEDIRALEQAFELDGLYETFSDIKAKGSLRPKKATVGKMFSGADKLKTLIEQKCAFEIKRFGYLPPN